MIVIIEICVQNKLSTYPEWVKGLRLLFMFSQILTNFNFSFVSNFFPIYAGTLEESHWTGLLAFGKGDFIKYLVTSLITRTSPMDIGYHVTYDNLVAKYCTIPLTVFRYLIWVWHGKIIIKIDFYQQKKIITILWLIVFHVRYTCLDYILVERNMLQWQDSIDSKLSM